MESARPATPEDLGTIAGLLAQASSELSTERGATVLLAREAAAIDPASRLHDPSCAVMAGLIDEVVVGVAIARLEDLADASRLAVIDVLYVEPEAREVGVGEQLVDAVTAWATGHGCRGLDSIVLPGMRASKNFFETFGLVARAILVHRDL